LGIWILLQPRFFRSGKWSNIHLLGGIHRRGNWRVANEEIWMFIGDANMDLSQADIPAGDTTIRVNGFIGDVKISIPPEVGFSTSCVAFVSETRINDHKTESFLAPFNYVSENFNSGEKRILLVTLHFISDIRIICDGR